MTKQQQEGSDTMLELKIINTEDARITCMQEPVKGEAKKGESKELGKNPKRTWRPQVMLTDNVLTI